MNRVIMAPLADLDSILFPFGRPRVPNPLASAVGYPPRYARPSVEDISNHALRRRAMRQDQRAIEATIPIRSLSRYVTLTLARGVYRHGAGRIEIVTHGDMVWGRRKYQTLLHGITYTQWSAWVPIEPVDLTYFLPTGHDAYVPAHHQESNYRD